MSFSSERLPEGQLWLMAIMHAFGYMRCDLLVLPSFDGKNFQQFHQASNFVYVIANNNLYFVDQAKHKYESLIEDDANKIKKLLAELKRSDSPRTMGIENLSLNQLNSIEKITQRRLLWDGMCHGLSVMAASANLLGEQEVLKFNSRLKLAAMMLLQSSSSVDFKSVEAEAAMKFFSQRFEQAKKNVIQHHRIDIHVNPSTTKNMDDEIYLNISNFSSFEELERSLTTEEQLSLDKAILDMQPFFDGVMIAQDFSSFKYLTSDPIAIQALKPAISFVSPVLLDSKDSDNQMVVLEKDLTAICDRTELRTVFQLITDYFKGISCSMQFGASGHSINVSYHPDRDVPFVVTDANNLPSKRLTIEEISELVAQALLCETGPVVFHEQMLVLAKDQSGAYNALEQMMMDPKWIKIQETTPERAKLVTQHGQSWLYCAAHTANKKLVNELLEQGADPALFDVQGNSPYSVAHTRNSEIASMMWTKICANIKEINLETKTEKGKLINRIADKIDSINLVQGRIEESKESIQKMLAEEYKLISELIESKNYPKDDEFQIDEKLRSARKNEKNAQESLLSLEESHKTLRNAKLSLVNEISRFKELENFIAFIKNKLVEKKVDVKIIEHIFDPIYAVFTKKEDVANELVKLFYRFQINFELPKRKLNKTEERFIEKQAEMGALLNKMLNIVPFILKILSDCQKYFDSKKSPEYRFFERESTTLMSYCDERAEKSDIDVISYNKIEQTIFDISFAFYKQLKEKKYDGDLENLSKIFNNNGINLQEKSQEKLYHQFIDAIQLKAEENFSFVKGLEKLEDQKQASRKFLGWIKAQLDAMTKDYQKPLGYSPAHFLKAKISSMSPKVNIGPNPLSAKFDEIFEDKTHDDEAKIDKVVELLIERVKRFVEKNVEVKRRFEVVKLASRLPGITSEVIKKDFTIKSADIKTRSHTDLMTIKLLQTIYEFCKEEKESESVLPKQWRDKLVKKLDTEIPGIHAIEPKAFQYSDLEHTLKQDPKNSTPLRRKGSL